MPDGAGFGVPSISGILHPYGGQHSLAIGLSSGQPDGPGGLSSNNYQQRNLAPATAKNTGCHREKSSGLWADDDNQNDALFLPGCQPDSVEEPAG